MRVLGFVLLVWVATACVRQSPQLPANKATAADSAGYAMQRANERLVTGEDSVLMAYVLSSGLNLSRDASGLWMHVETKTSGPLLKELETCSIHYRIFSLSNELLYEKTETITMGKKQVISGIEIALRSMRKNEQAQLLVPWYLAYGLQGNGNRIPPYTSLRIELKRL